MIESDNIKMLILEEKLFLELRDNPVASAENFKKKYKELNINHSRLYRKIINYQIKKYGSSLNNSTYINPEDYKKRSIVMKNLRYAKRHKN